MEQFEIGKRYVSNVVKHRYSLEYLDKEKNRYFLISEETYGSKGKAQTAANKKIEQLKKENKSYHLFKCKFPQVTMPKKELNRMKSTQSMIADEEYEPKWNIIRKGKPYSIKEVLSKYCENDAPVDFDGDLIPMGSHRYANFKFHGVTCKCCGIVGQYFRKERFYKDYVYHFNLYAVDADGNEVLMTKDHILAKSNGGKDEVDNYQPFCETCNKRKKSMDNETFMLMMKAERKQNDTDKSRQD